MNVVAALCLVATALGGALAAAVGAVVCLRWLVRLSNSKMFEVPAHGVSDVDVEHVGPLDVYLQVPRFRASLTNLTAEVEGEGGELRSRWRWVVVGPFLRPGVATYKGVETQSVCVGRVWFEEPGPYTVRVVDGPVTRGKLLFCPPTGWWIPVAIVSMILCILAIPGSLVGGLFCVMSLLPGG